ncbi:MAG: putative peptidoglycan glycosyltransferase FtsW [Bacteroidales bacterium]|nr:putative peptidoglycan glycosyltransferase FtsW [Bacteroidales bacterium]MDZ4204620.1 putative peptidoglycan glycosyltransferase FtsW [Bacteroidales bacterium]
MRLVSIIKNVKGDKAIWGVVILLAVFSLLAVYSSTGTLAYRYKQGNTEFYMLKHLGILFFGLVLMYLAHKVHFNWYGKFAFAVLVIVIPLLAYTLFFGTRVNEASRWATLPLINLSFQPSDFAKLAILIYLARVLGKNQDYVKDFKFNLVFIIIPVLVIVMLILPANFSTAVILYASCLIIMFIGRVKPLHLIGLIGVSVAAIGILVLLLWAYPEYSRIQTWKNRIENHFGDNPDGKYQSDQAKIAIANGGVIGKQPGNSVQKNFLPQPYSDFIFAIIIEEYGLIGGSVMVLLYLILLFRGASIATRTESKFGAFLTFGLAFSLVLQAMINMAVAVGMIPVTGQPLPLVSMGGTSLWFTSISIGIILSVSRSLETETKTDEQYVEV